MTCLALLAFLITADVALVYVLVHLDRTFRQQQTQPDKENPDHEAL